MAAVSLLFICFLINSGATVEKRGSADLNEEIIRLRRIDQDSEREAELGYAVSTKAGKFAYKAFCRGLSRRRLVSRYPPV
jgi:hypothetical protein